MRLPKTAALALMLITCPALGQKIDLRGPAPQAGQTIVTTNDSESESSDFTMNAQGQNIEGQMATKAHQLIVTEILEVTDGQATKVKTTFKEHKSTSTMTIFGQEQQQDDTNLQGMVVTQTLTDDGWETTTQGGAIQIQDNEALKKSAYLHPRIAFPAEQVEPGHKWKIKGDELAAFMGQGQMPGATYDGDIEFEFKEIKAVEGVQVAVIAYDADGSIQIGMNTGGMDMDMTIKMKGKGLIERNLASYTNASVFEGDMDFEMQIGANGQPMMTMTTKLPIKGTTTQDIKAQ